MSVTESFDKTNSASEENEEAIVNQKVVYDKEKRMHFYEKLRKKILKGIKGKAGQKGEKISQYLLALPDFFILLCRLAADERIEKKIKLFIGGIIAYVILPVDIIPDFIPVFGLVDDLVLVVYGLNIILNEIDKQILLGHWSGEEDLLELLQKITATAEDFLDKNILNKIKHWINRIKKNKV